MNQILFLNAADVVNACLPAVFNSEFTINPATFSDRLTLQRISINPETVCLSLSAAVQASNSSSHTVLPSYTALKPCALTAKSVVNHKANIDPLLTIGDGSMNPDNLEKNKTKHINTYHIEQQQKKPSLMCNVYCSLMHGRRRQEC